MIYIVNEGSLIEQESLEDSELYTYSGGWAAVENGRAITRHWDRRDRLCAYLVLRIGIPVSDIKYIEYDDELPEERGL